MNTCADTTLMLSSLEAITRICGEVAGHPIVAKYGPSPVALTTQVIALQ